MYRIGPFTLCRRLYKRVTVDKQTQQIIDGYKMVSMLWVILFPFYLAGRLIGIIDRKFMLTFRPFYYKYFNSWDKDPLPVRDYFNDGTFTETDLFAPEDPVDDNITNDES